MTTSSRYRIQTLNATGQWEDTRARSNYPQSLASRIANFPRPQDSRVWDTETDTLYIAPPLYVETEEQKTERVARWEAAKLVDQKYWADKDAENAKLRAQWKRETQEARESLEQKTLSTTEDFDNLSDHEKALVTCDLQDAHNATNIDGYGDEGEGYNMEEFAANLIRLGWEYNPKGKN